MSDRKLLPARVIVANVLRAIGWWWLYLSAVRALALVAGGQFAR